MIRRTVAITIYSKPDEAENHADFCPEFLNWQRTRNLRNLNVGERCRIEFVRNECDTRNSQTKDGRTVEKNSELTSEMCALFFESACSPILVSVLE